jgi:hypothetical protein
VTSCEKVSLCNKLLTFLEEKKMRRKSNFIWAAVVFVVLALCGSTLVADINEGLISHWRFDEGSGTIAYDSAGTNDGTIYGATWITGQIDSALSFDGVDDYVEVDDNPSLDITDEITVEAWVKRTPNEHLVVASKRLLANNSGYSCVVDPDGSLGGTVFEQFDHRSTTTIPMDMFNHVAWTYDKNAGVSRLYINGILDSTFFSTASISTNDQPLQIARVESFSSGVVFGSGIIDEVRIYDRALTAEEIEQLYQVVWPDMVSLEITGPEEVVENFSASYQAIAHYDDDSTRDVTDSALWVVEPNMYASIEAGVLTTKDIVNDQSATILAGYTEGEVTVAAEKTIDILAICPTGTALSFDGVDDYVEAPKLTNLNKNYLTMAAWVYPIAPATDTYSTVIFSGDSTSGNDIHLALTENLELLCRADGEATDGIFFTSENTIQLNKWQHIACVFNNTTNKAYAYVNGETVLDATYLTYIPIDFLWYTQIGRMRGPDPRHNKWYFNGNIDEVKIYNRALSAEEIRANMYTRLSGDEVGLVGYWDFDEGQGQIVYDLSGNGNDGQLGSTPDVDTSDPAWIESDAPIGLCNPYLIATAAAKKALEHKRASLKELHAALAQEWKIYEALEQWLESGDFVDLSKGDIVTAKQKAHSAMQHEEQSIDMLGKGFEKLLDSLIPLGYGPESLMPY